MKSQLLITALSILLSMGVYTSAQDKPNVPVMLYPDTDHGTCNIGLRVKFGGAKLRAGPGKDYPVVARLKAGQVISACDEADGWDGIIDSQDETCSVGISVAQKQPYAGPCKSGWINQKRVTQIYG